MAKPARDNKRGAKGAPPKRGAKGAPPKRSGAPAKRSGAAAGRALFAVVEWTDGRREEVDQFDPRVEVVERAVTTPVRGSRRRRQPLWTMVWWRRHNNTPLSRSVSPPSSHGFK